MIPARHLRTPMITPRFLLLFSRLSTTRAAPVLDTSRPRATSCRQGPNDLRANWQLLHTLDTTAPSNLEGSVKAATPDEQTRMALLLLAWFCSGSSGRCVLCTTCDTWAVADETRLFHQRRPTHGSDSTLRDLHDVQNRGEGTAPLHHARCVRYIPLATFHRFLRRNFRS